MLLSTLIFGRNSNHSFLLCCVLKGIRARLMARSYGTGMEAAMAANHEHDLLTCDEAASYLRLHVRTVGRLLNQGKLPGVKVGRQWRLRRADLDAYLRGASLRSDDTGHAASSGVD